MAERVRLLTAEDVLEELERGDDFDELDEPMMAGSDDEFNDCDLDENENDDNDNNTNLLTSIQPQQGSSGASLPSSSCSASPPSTPPTQWSSVLSSVSISDFTSPVGPTVAVPESPSEVFELMFTPSLTDTIVEQTNLYAKQVMRDEKYTDWDEVTSDELKAYLGFCILIGINRLPALDDYWNSDRTLRYPPIADKISRERDFSLPSFR